MIALSIIIPVYNAEQHLERCLTSVVSELTASMEVILIDDGSKDGSLRLCERFAGPQVTVRHHANHGVSYTRNLGIEQARGRCILFVDADDYLVEGWSDIVLRAIALGKQFVAFSRKFLGQSPTAQDLIDRCIGIPSALPIGNTSTPTSKLYEKELLISQGIRFPESVINGEDALFNLQVFNAMRDFACVPEAIYYYRLNYASATHTFNDAFFASNQVYLTQLESILQQSGLAPQQIADDINFCRFTGLYLLLYRISTLDSARKRRDTCRETFCRQDVQADVRQVTVRRAYGLMRSAFVQLAKWRLYSLAVGSMRLLHAVKRRTKKQREGELI